MLVIYLDIVQLNRFEILLKELPQTRTLHVHNDIPGSKISKEPDKEKAYCTWQIYSDEIRRRREFLS